MFIGAGLMFYNALRFDNPLEFGQRYQLPLTVHQQFRLRFFWFNFRVGFLEPARWTAGFPFVHDIAVPSLPAGYWQVDHAFGVLSNIPLVWLALAAPLAWRGREAEGRSNLRWFCGALALLFGMCALPLGFHDSMCLRYELEFASPLVLLAAVGVPALERALASRPVWRLAARCGWVLLLVFSLAFNLLVNLRGQENSRIILGNELLRMGRAEEANAQFQKALELAPNDMEAYWNIGYAFVRYGRVDEAIALYQKALHIRPDSAIACYNLGNALLQKGRVDEAILEYQKAVEIQPAFALAHDNLGAALQQMGRLDEAIPQYQKAAQLKPDFASTRVNLANALAQEGRDNEAIPQYQKALQLNPADPAIQNKLAWLLATCPQPSLRNGGKALEVARQANLLTGGENPVILHTLAAACAEAGRFSEAVETAQHALRLAQAQTNTALAGALQSELILYRAGSPFHSPEQPH
jgi:tetratricopeptide (TPR) repeat protein